ncbi:hypothetical protein RIF29_38133 [Crotalaria pallida]|uniref:Uncharacterized protein n=1 Tax=Crotalaria pallida TaxID=3830 RepID=A0AAN9E454_CROPI
MDKANLVPKVSTPVANAAAPHQQEASNGGVMELVNGNPNMETCDPGEQIVSNVNLQHSLIAQAKSEPSPFGPWMLVQRFQRNKKRTTSNNNHNEDFSGSRYEVLLDDNEEPNHVHGESTVKENNATENVTDLGPTNIEEVHPVETANLVTTAMHKPVSRIRNPQQKANKNSQASSHGKKGPHKQKNFKEGTVYSKEPQSNVNFIKPTPLDVEGRRIIKEKEKEVLHQMRILQKINNKNFIENNLDQVYLPTEEEFELAQRIKGNQAVVDAKSKPPDNVMDIDTQKNIVLCNDQKASPPCNKDLQDQPSKMCQ